MCLITPAYHVRRFSKVHSTQLECTDFIELFRCIHGVCVLFFFFLITDLLHIQTSAKLQLSESLTFDSRVLWCGGSHVCWSSGPMGAEQTKAIIVGIICAGTWWRVLLKVNIQCSCIQKP